MDLTASDLWLPGAAVQLTALLAALGGVLVVTLPAVGRSWWRRSRPPVAPDPDEVARALNTAGVPDAENAPDVSAGPPTSPLAAIRLVGATLIVLLVLPAAALVRQLWPHPDLGLPLFLGWLALLLVSTLAWLAVALADRQRER
jgi:hypothetical protein